MKGKNGWWLTQAEELEGVFKNAYFPCLKDEEVAKVDGGEVTKESKVLLVGAANPLGCDAHRLEDVPGHHHQSQMG